ncbi:hypothetical protein HC931_26725 [Candidatus Gracilibacteria bacterium]|nr:hypothetical protein [Candidatus Gracilibacteria bacterium]NJP21147.1 hypothetical protein [Hydrococcus sp. CRU_1_1]
MSTKTFVLYNLAILTVGSLSCEAVASPQPLTVKLLSVPRWTDNQNSRPSSTPRWFEHSENDSGQLPQWSEQKTRNVNDLSRWTERSSNSPLEDTRSVRARTTLQWSQTASSWGSFPTTLQSDVAFEIYPQAINSLATLQSDSAVVRNRESPELLASENRESKETESAPKNNSIESEVTEDSASSSLTHFSSTQPTGEYLRQGEVSFNIYNRLYFPPNYIENAVFDSDTGAYPNFGFSWGITDDLQIGLEFQQVDSGSPGRQGDFESLRRPGDDEIALEIKQKIWENEAETLNLSGVLALSWGNRDFRFRRVGQATIERRNSSIVPAIQLPFTADVGDRWRFTLSPTLAFFNDKSAVFYQQLPIDNPGSFGTTFGFAGAISFQVNPRLVLWGDAFLPVAGNNSISRESGRPDTAIGFNAGLRYLVNPRLAVDIFASNTQGNKGPLALTADRDLLSIGAGVIFMPDFIGANRRSAGGFGDEEDSPPTIDGLGFLDGGTLNGGQFQVQLQAGTPGISTALRYGFLKDFEGGVYFNYAFGNVDESEQGISGKIRFLNQSEGAPLTASLAVTLSQTNQPFINFFENNRDELRDRGLKKSAPFLLNQDSLQTGQLNIVTVSIPLNYQFDSGLSLWLTPTLGYVQRMGAEIAGFNAGGSVPIADDFSLIGEIGANLIGDGNAFLGDSRANVIPWTFAVRWDPSSFLGFDRDSRAIALLSMFSSPIASGFLLGSKCASESKIDCQLG